MPAPTVADVQAWTRTSGQVANEGNLATALAAAVGHVEVICTLPSGDYTDDLFLGTMMLAARLSKRTDSPGGVQGMGPDGFAVRITARDPDIASLLGPYLKLDGFA